MATSNNNSSLTATEIQKCYEATANMPTRPLDPTTFGAWRDDHFADAVKYGAGNATMKAGPPPLRTGGTENKFTEMNMNSMIASRMGWNMDAPRSPFSKYSAHKLDESTAVVFVINGSKAVLIHDDLNLFPSDALVTQLRLLEN